MSAQPSSPYGAMQSPRKRSCSEVSSPLGTCRYEGGRSVFGGEGQGWERQAGCSAELSLQHILCPRDLLRMPHASHTPPCTHLEAHHEAAGGALAAVEQARPLQPHINVIQVQVLPARLALPAAWCLGLSWGNARQVLALSTTCMTASKHGSTVAPPCKSSIPHTRAHKGRREQ